MTNKSNPAWGPALVLDSTCAWEAERFLRNWHEPHSWPAISHVMSFRDDFHDGRLVHLFRNNDTDGYFAVIALDGKWTIVAKDNS